jgi:hypothetical protein
VISTAPSIVGDNHRSHVPRCVINSNRSRRKLIKNKIFRRRCRLTSTTLAGPPLVRRLGQLFEIISAPVVYNWRTGIAFCFTSYPCYTTVIRINIRHTFFTASVDCTFWTFRCRLILGLSIHVCENKLFI